MPLETASHITDLVSTNPASGDQVAVADDHLRLIKSVLLTDFATISGPITATVTEINSLNGILKTQLDRAGSLTTTNTSTAYNLATNTVFASLSAMNGKAIIFKPHVTSGVSPTLNVDGLGAVALKSIAGTVIPTGALLVGGRYAVTYNDSATEFVVHGIFGVLPSTQFSGAVTVQAGGLTVTAGASTFGAAVTISSGGAAITGNSSVTGTLGVSSDFAINTNKFTVAASSGNTLVAGTLNVTGVITGSHAAPTVQKFTTGTAATYTPTTGTVRIRVRMAGGGAGGGAQTTNNGANGGTTTFGSWTAIGGNGGVAVGTAGGTGGTGGAPGTGLLITRFDGADGTGGMNTTGAYGGDGGQTPFGGAGKGVRSGAGGNAKANTGSGGAGGGGTSVNTGSGGGAGEYVEFWVNSPTPTTYTVGTAGAGGGAGVLAGGNGAVGPIIIEEFYS